MCLKKKKGFWSFLTAVHSVTLVHATTLQKRLNNVQKTQEWAPIRGINAINVSCVKYKIISSAKKQGGDHACVQLVIASSFDTSQASVVQPPSLMYFQCFDLCLLSVWSKNSSNCLLCATNNPPPPPHYPLPCPTELQSLLVGLFWIMNSCTGRSFRHFSTEMDFAQQVS